MNRERTIETLKAHERELRARGVTRLAIFGSMVTGEARPESDVDVLVDVDRSRKFSLIDTPEANVEHKGFRSASLHQGQVLRSGCDPQDGDRRSFVSGRPGSPFAFLVRHDLHVG